MTSLIGSKPLNTTGGNISSSQTGFQAGNKVPKGYQMGQVQNFTPEMMGLFQQLIGQVGPDSYLSKLAGGDEAIFNQIEQPSLKQFGGLQAGLASKFSGMGQGSRNSSGFQNTQNQAAMDFASQLQANRQNLQQTALKDLMSMGNQLLGNRPYDQFLVEEEEEQNPWWKNLIGGGLRGGGAALGAYFGGPMGGMAGLHGGNAIAKSFGI